MQKKQLIALCLGALGALAILFWVQGQSPSPVTVTLAPLPSSVTNWITTNALGQPIATNGTTLVLVADASSVVRDIARVEFYDVFSNSITHVVTTNLISVVTNRPFDPLRAKVY